MKRAKGHNHDSSEESEKDNEEETQLIQTFVKKVF